MERDSPKVSLTASYSVNGNGPAMPSPDLPPFRRILTGPVATRYVKTRGVNDLTLSFTPPKIPRPGAKMSLKSGPSSRPGTAPAPVPATAAPAPNDSAPPAPQHAAETPTEPAPPPPAPKPTGPPLLEIRAVSKSFGETRANEDVSLTLYPGEKHALLGENGAGKSTLVKMIYGVLRPDSGTLTMDGKPLRLSSPADARSRGIGMVFQHFSTFEALSVAENLAVVLPDRSLSAIRRDVRAISEDYGLAVEPDRNLGTLSAGERQRVEIVRCLLQNPKLLIMDEPTSVLTPQEAAALFKTLDRLARDGCAILYISHRLEEVRALCDRATVLRRGKVVGECDPRAQSAAALAEMMIGELLTRPGKQASFIGKPRLAVEGLSLPSKTGIDLSEIEFTARKGEILGIVGVAGEGQAELFAALSGETPVQPGRTIRLDDRPIGHLGPTSRRRMGLASAPERRIGHAAIADMRLSENLRLTHHALPGRIRAAEIRDRFDVRADGSDPFAGALSGGNLQKFVIGREIAREPHVLVVEQPTWGVDAGAAVVIHQALMDLARSGAAIIVISQDLDETLSLCDRVAVLYRGKLSPPQVTAQVDARTLGLLMAGITPVPDEDRPKPQVVA